MNRLKKMLTVGVMTMSVLSMTMVVGPVKAATLVDGSLIRTNVKSATGGYAVYYLSGGKRYLFPAEKVYKSWYMNSQGKADFSKVQVVSETDMYSYQFGGNVVYRPATKLVTFYEPMVYAVEPSGTIRSIVSADNAAALFGTNWTSLIEDIDPSLRTNYTVGTDMVLGKYPVGQVLSSGGTFYYYDGTNYRQFASEAALLANGFNKFNVVATTMAITAGGTQITGMETALTNTAQGAATGTTGGVATGTGSGLTVALAADTPAATTYVRDTGAVVAQSVAPFTKINFTASSDGDVVVSTVKLTRSGISADTDLSTVYLYDGSTRLAEHTSISSKVITFTNSAGLFTIPKGTTKTITVKADISASTATVSGIILGINAAADITAGTAVVTGSFPVNGNSMGVGTVADLGSLQFTSATLGTFPANIDPGLTNQELFRFSIKANDQQMNLESIKLTIVGTVSSTDLANLMLKDTAGTQIGSTITAMNSAKELNFDASASPYLITSGQTKTLVVYGDVVNGSGRAFRFTIRKSADLVVKDNGYGIYTAPLISTGAAFALIDSDAAGDGTNINNGTITSGIATDTPTGNVAAGATGVTLAKMTLKANGEDVKVNYLTVNANTSGGEAMKNGKLYWSGTQVGSTDVSVDDLGDADTTDTFTVNQILKAGTTVEVRYDADTINAADDTAMTGTVTVSLAVSTTDATGQSSLSNVSIAAVTGRSLTFSAGTLTAARNLAFGNMATANPTGVKGSLAAKVGSFVVTAGTGEGSSITQIVITDDDDDTTEDFGDNFQNLKLMNGATQLSTTQGTLSGTAGAGYTFSISPAVTLGAGQQLVVDIYADILTGAAGYITGGQHVGLEITSVTGTGLVTSGATTVSSLTTDLQTLYISANGNLTVTTDSTSPTAAHLVMGSTDNTIGAFRFDAGTSSEAINISMINIDGGDADATSYTNIKFYDGGTLLGTVATFNSANDAVLNLATNWVIPKGQTKVLTIKADVNTADNTTAIAGDLAESTLSIVDNSKITSIGAGSGQAITETVGTVSASAMTFVKTKVTVAAAGNTPSGSAGKSSEATVAIFRFSNSSNVAGQQATVTDLAIDIATSGTWTTLSPTASVKVYKNSVATGNLLGTGAPATSPVSVAWGAWGGASLTDFTIASGSYIDIFVTANTTGAPTSGTFTASIPSASGVKWEDGIYTTTDLVTVDTLPVTGGTLTY